MKNSGEESSLHKADPRAIWMPDVSERLFRLLAENAGEWLSIFSEDGRYHYVSPACKKITGHEPHEFLTNPELLNSLIHPDDADMYFLHMRHFGSLSEHHGEFRIVRRDGETRWIAHHCQPMYDENSHFIGRCSSNRDITEEKLNADELELHRCHLQELVDERSAQIVQLNALLQERAESAEMASQAKSSFLANMSHEIRTPMNAIVGFTHMLRRNCQSPDQADKLDKIASSADHLLGVINDILDISKIEAGKVVLERSHFELDGLLTRICSMVIERIHRKGLELVIDNKTGLGSVQGDATRLGQALLNYLGNAVKFTEHGTIVLRAEILETSGDEILIRFAVEDTGIGIAEEDQRRLFQAFEQADNSVSRRFGGTGLGLVITSRIASLMGGEAGLESTPDIGSTFWMTVRLGRECIPEGEALLPHLAGKRALVVDDTPITRLAHVHLLQMNGLESEAQSSGRSALAAILLAELKGKPFDLLMLDLHMPGMNGFETLAALRQLPLHYPPKVFLVTASGEPQLAKEAREAGFDDVLLKPLSIALVQGLLRIHLAEVFSGCSNSSKNVPELSVLSPEDQLRANYSDASLLLVEDEPINQEVALMLLEEIGWKVDVASNGKEAVSMAKGTNYDLILMDMQMPVMSGLEATRQIRRFPGGENIPILAMTASAFMEDRHACIKAGMNDFLTKPVSPEVLFEKILKLLMTVQRK